MKRTILRLIFNKINKKNIKAIVLFGSRARGDYNKKSDYDINVFTSRIYKRLASGLSDYSKGIFVNIVCPKELKEKLDKGHSFAYCTFRDGIPLYQKKSWFNKTKPEILKLKPSKEIISLYLESSLSKLISSRKHKVSAYFEYEDNKVAVNQLGFAILMAEGSYPKSPHTITRELKETNEKYKELARAIEYIQNTYYLSKIPRRKKYFNNIYFLVNFAKRYVKQKFPEVLERV